MFNILASQFIAPTLFLNWPSFSKLTVEKITHEDPEWYFPTEEEFGEYSGITPEDCEPYRIPARTIISVKSKHGRGDITINEEIGDIITMGEPRFSFSDSSSGAIRTILFGIPSLIIASPIILANHFIWSALEAMTGMERHAWSVWLRIKGQLDPLTYVIAEKSFQKYKGKDYGR